MYPFSPVGPPSRRTSRPGFPARLEGNTGTPAQGTRAKAQSKADSAAQLPQGVSHDLEQLLRADPIAARARMVQYLAASGLRNDKVLRAMAAVQRHSFVEPGLSCQAYEDMSLPIGMNQTISKPSVVARMLELLLQGGLKDEQGKLGRVLDVGTGCGYQAVVLSQLASEVYSIERLRELHEQARTNLRPLRIANVHLILGDGTQGFAKGAPYAGIIAAASGQALPSQWIEQLAEGGRIVAPIAVQGKNQALLVVDKTRSGIAQTVLETVNFVPLKSGIA